MKAVKNVFPQTVNLLCSWHINKNVLSQGQELEVYTKASKEKDSFMTFW